MEAGSNWKTYVVTAILAYLVGVKIDRKKNVNDIIALAKEHKLNKQYIRSIYLFYCAGKLQDLEGDMAALGLASRIRDITNVVQEMYKNEKNAKEHVISFVAWFLLNGSDDENKKNVKDHVIPLMKELLEDLRKIKGGTSEYKVLQQVCCLSDIALCYVYIGENRRAVEFSESAIELMSRKMGKKAKTYRLYGDINTIAGVAYLNTNQYLKAADMLQKALDVYESSYWINMEDKKKAINFVKANLENAKYPWEFWV